MIPAIAHDDRTHDRYHDPALLPGAPTALPAAPVPRLGATRRHRARRAAMAARDRRQLVVFHLVAARIKSANFSPAFRTSSAVNDSPVLAAFWSDIPIARRSASRDRKSTRLNSSHRT